MLYIINETTFNGYSVYNLDSLHIIAVLFGIFVIVSKNPIVSVLFLIGLFLSISGYLILTGLNFIGLAYLLVYIGAVSILFLFILMLINVRISELLIDSINSIPLAILLGSFFNYFVNNVLPYTVMTNSLFYNFSIKKNLTNVTSVSWDGYLAETSHITTIGNILYGNYSIWLILTSIILLLSMIGCIVITLKEKDDQRTGDTLIGYPVFANSLNHSGFNHLFPRKIRTLLRRFFIKLRAIGMIVFSRENIKYTSRRLFTMRTLCIVVSSIVMGNIVRYYAIKYGIDTPLLSHPILFSSAAGISSFLSILSRITIEDIFNLFEDKQLALPVGELPVSKNSLTIDTNMKMVRGTGSGTGNSGSGTGNSGNSTGSTMVYCPVRNKYIPTNQGGNPPGGNPQGGNPQGGNPPGGNVQGQGQAVNVPYPKNVTFWENLNKGYLGFLNSEPDTKKVFVEIDSKRLGEEDSHVYLAFLIDEFKEDYAEAKDRGLVSGSPKYRNFGVSSPADEEKIRKLILEVKPSRNVRNTGMTNELINLLYDKKN
jgi:NADH-ubiquinone oxidoreductase chain 6